MAEGIEESSEEVIRGFYESFARGDVPAVLAAMSDEIEWHEAEGMPYGGVYNSPQEVAENVFGPLIADMPDFAATPEQMLVSGETVAVVARYTGTGAATGKSLDLPVAHVYEVKDGKVSRFRQFVDTVQFLDVVPDEKTTAG